ncbi:hypothetical protein [Caproicibacterium amylolyticum]|uniref:Beta-1,6-galactofuranosyltransferase n=1 Tax=Caproicibacterium amylolyticum TaxID=2766537 RepID=A0A7G9WJS0_9FIRM|nr:hypothetical protein [Caproicibacterium amylolyticum]QNO18932.1 hypothetical protein H6X83_04710 [Caproicibacterium amylolyticum]
MTRSGLTVPGDSMKNYYIALTPTLENTAWSKATDDVEYFLCKMNFQPIPVSACGQNTEVCLSQMLGQQSQGIVLLQYPKILFENFNLSGFLNCMKRNHQNYKSVALVHDLDSIRFGNFFLDGQLPELAALNQFDYLIAVNDSMAAVLKEHGAKPPIYSLTLFDYRLDSGFEMHRSWSPTAVFAGNLKYEKFIYQLHELDWKSSTLNVYGPNFDASSFVSCTAVTYCGELPPDALATEVADSYGLCWEGDSLDRCRGKISAYLKYTNPYKVSFYLALGLPVILSKQMAAASFIEQNNAGVAIDSLRKLPEVLTAISEREYQSMCENCLRLSQKLRHGYFLSCAVQQIEYDMQTT